MMNEYDKINLWVEEEDNSKHNELNVCWDTAKEGTRRSKHQ